MLIVAAMDYKITQTILSSLVQFILLLNIIDESIRERLSIINYDLQR